MSRIPIWFFLAPFLASNVGTAQTPVPLVEGQRVRVAYRCEARGQALDCRESGRARIATGQLQAFDGNSLRIRAQSNNADLLIPTASLTDVWVGEGTRRHFWTGAGIGLLGGALLGGIIGSASEFCLGSCGPATAIGIVVGAPAGLVLGAAVGAAIRSDRWRSASIKNHHIQVEPRLTAIGMTVSLAF